MSSCNIKSTEAEDPRNQDHPCFSEKAHHYFARMHLSVAPGCNIQCNYCNRKYNCANESRPGVVVDQLTPEEALKKVYYVAGELKELSVIGIAGQGDSLCSVQRTLKTMDLINQHFPDLKLCLSTNGLMLPKYAEEIAKRGVDHVTVTVNTLNPKTAQEVYEWVKVGGKKRNDIEAMAYFAARQLEGIRSLVNLGVQVKVNSLLMPGINDDELPKLSKRLKQMGVFMHNIMPLIAQPEHGTKFGLEGRPEPTEEQMNQVREACGDMKQMTHCHQCRADAVGKLGEDHFEEYGKEKWRGLEIPETATGVGAKQREVWRSRIAHHLGRGDVAEEIPVKVAAVSEGMGLINQHFGHAKKFYIYHVYSNRAELSEIREIPAPYCNGDETCGDKETLLDLIIRRLEGCSALVCLKVGYPIFKKLEAAGILPVIDQPMQPVIRAVRSAAEQALEHENRNPTEITEEVS